WARRRRRLLAGGRLSEPADFSGSAAAMGSHPLEQWHDVRGADCGGADAVGRGTRSLEEPAVGAARGQLDPSRTRLYSTLRRAARMGSGSGGSPGISDGRGPALSHVQGHRRDITKDDPYLSAL